MSNHNDKTTTEKLIGGVVTDVIYDRVFPDTNLEYTSLKAIIMKNVDGEVALMIEKGSCISWLAVSDIPSTISKLRKDSVDKYGGV